MDNRRLSARTTARPPTTYCAGGSCSTPWIWQKLVSRSPEPVDRGSRPAAGEIPLGRRHSIRKPLPRGRDGRDFDLAMGIVEQACLPESPERHGNARPPRPQHHRKKLVTEGHDVVVDAISRHEQPARQPLLNRMASIARRRLRYLCEECLGITKQPRRKHRTSGSSSRRGCTPILSAAPAICTICSTA